MLSLMFPTIALHWYHRYMSLRVEADSLPGTRERIVKAAALLLAEGGPGAVTTRAVAGAAGTAAPTIYRLFGDKDGLMDAVAEHVMATYVAATSGQTAPANADPIEALRNAWQAHLDFALANPDIFMLLNAFGRAQHSPATAAGMSMLEARVGAVAAAGLLGISESRAVSMIHAAGTGAVLAVLQQPQDCRDNTLPDAMLQAVLAAVLAENPAPPASALAALAVALRCAVPELPELTDAERALLDEWLTRSIDTLMD